MRGRVPCKPDVTGMMNALLAANENGSRASHLSGLRPSAPSSFDADGGSVPGIAMASDKLSTYKQKRDFQKTQEPSGQAKLKASNRGRFVIQKHDATRLHYDLRLELDGVFKSWAVTKGAKRERLSEYDGATIG